MTRTGMVKNTSVRASKLRLRRPAESSRLRETADTRTGKMRKTLVRAFSLLFGVAKAIYRRRFPRLHKGETADTRTGQWNNI